MSPALAGVMRVVHEPEASGLAVLDLVTAELFAAQPLGVLKLYAPRSVIAPGGVPRSSRTTNARAILNGVFLRDRQVRHERDPIRTCSIAATGP